ncbi:pimeloyl-ACP methyl ester esterase BioH [Ferrigenium sp. UT5]|uniref:pimeloyl-ACP methyl ester esterase BioH n=1 Tax=Ferrigenium sp. UT5 TaxID=3242105 RepID=UPI00354CB858
MHVDVSGCGAALVMLHGWGMHGGVWGDVVARLSQQVEVHNVDLPGHGFSVGRASARLMQDVGLKPDLQLDCMVDALSDRFPEPVSVLGWSLGGLIAQRWAAREPHKIERLILVASTPCFTAREDWLCGMPAATLQQFAAELENNHAATLRRFLALQLRGSENERELLSQLREKLFRRGEPELDALRAGLDILREVDLRGELAQISSPTLVVAGERDKLTPPQASRYLAENIPTARRVEIRDAAHLPFLSHAEKFIGPVAQFLRE